MEHQNDKDNEDKGAGSRSAPERSDSSYDRDRRSRRRGKSRRSATADLVEKSVCTAISTIYIVWLLVLIILAYKRTISWWVALLFAVVGLVLISMAMNRICDLVETFLYRQKKCTGKADYKGVSESSNFC
jgi:hypothetical protein